MKIAVAGLALESVSFLPLETRLEAFEQNASRGGDMIEALRDTASVGGGFIELLEQEKAKIIPLVYTDVSAAGNASDETFEAYRDEITDGLKSVQGDLDGMLLYLHGAMTTPTRHDPELEILQAVRQVVGDGLPVMVVFDLHANLSLACADLCTALFGFRKSPHTDMAETGKRAAHCLIETLKDRQNPVMVFRKVPLVLPSILTATDLEPLSGILLSAFAREDQENTLIDVSVFCGFAYADVPDIGFSVAVVADGDEIAATQAVDEICADILKHKEALSGALQVHDVEDGISKALVLSGDSSKPVVLLEHADRMNDSTWGLRELIRQKANNVIVPYLWDAKAAEAALAAGAGTEITLSVGGHSSDRSGGPVRIEGKVLYAGRKVYTGTGPMRLGRRIDLGPTALVQTGGIIIQLTSTSISAIDEDCFIQFGLEARNFNLILLRSKTHFRAVYEDLAEEIVIIDSPDWGPAGLDSLPYRNVRAGVFPIS